MQGMRSPPETLRRSFSHLLSAGRSHQTHAPGPQSACIAKHDESRQPLSIPVWAPPGRQTDGQKDRPLCIALQALPGRQMDRQTAVRWGSQADGEPLAVRRRPGGTSSAHRLHLVEDAPSRSRSGKPPLGTGDGVRGSAQHRWRAGTAGGSPVGWGCWHPAGTPTPRLCLHGLNNTLAPVQLLQGINAVEFISTDGGQFSSRRLTDTRCPSLRRVLVWQRPVMESRCIMPCSSCRSAAERISLSPFRGI